MKAPGFSAANSDGYRRVLTDRHADEGESLDVQRRLADLRGANLREADLEEGLDNYCRASPTSPFHDAVDAFIPPPEARRHSTARVFIIEFSHVYI
jgi:hypothetical protein